MKLDLSKEQQLIFLGLILSIMVGFGVMLYHNLNGSSDAVTIENETMKAGPIAAAASQVMVHLSGAVKREGVYRMNSGDRLMEALRTAGGALYNADLSAVNLSEQIKDGEKIVIPFKPAAMEQVSADRAVQRTVSVGSKVNINSADEKALDALPGIGPSTARAIVEHRRTSGPFNRIEQIMEIPRFGKSKFERIKNKITL